MTVLPNPGSCPMPFRVCFVFRHSEPVLCQRIIIYITHHSFAYLTRISHPSWIQVQSIMNRLCTSSKVLILDTSIGLWWPAIRPACLLGILMQFKLNVVPARVWLHVTLLYRLWQRWQRWQHQQKQQQQKPTCQCHLRENNGQERKTSRNHLKYEHGKKTGNKPDLFFNKSLILHENSVFKHFASITFFKMLINIRITRTRPLKAFFNRNSFVLKYRKWIFILN